MNIIQVYRQFPTQESCIRHLEKVRWGDIPVCAYCGSTNTYPLKGELRHHCNACRKSFSVTIGTIFFDTRLPMQKWFLAIALILNAKKGISSRQLARDLELPVKTAWSVGHRIRKAMNDDGALLCGVVEMDETFVGGKVRPKNHRNDDDDTPTYGKGKWGKSNKIPVVGMVERKGKVKAKPFERRSVTGQNLQALVRQSVKLDGTVLVTDTGSAYRQMHSVLPHVQVNHFLNYALDEFTHTNGIESFWAILKRGIVGQYHKVSEKYLHRYVDEFCYRFNGRNMDGGMLWDMTVNRMLAA
jgi:transposase-like protein